MIANVCVQNVCRTHTVPCKLQNRRWVATKVVNLMTVSLAGSRVRQGRGASS